MIISAIFETYTNYTPHLKRLLALLILLSPMYSALAQYTETINSNRPGASQGAFAVGRQVVQAETGIDFGNDTHSLRQFDSDIFGINFGLRYGLLFEKLEINTNLRYQANQVRFTSGRTPDDVIQGLESLLLGGKYLIYDPYKYATDEVNLYSYHANNKFKWKSLIPAISVYAAGVFDFTVNPFREFLAAGSGEEIEEGISPNVAIITQNNWGTWVWVNNFIADRFTTDFPTYTWITTMTHTFTPKFSGFVEAQLINGDLNSDLLGRAGAAYLITSDLQVDVSGLFNVKDTPARWNVGIGVSYRLDFHDKDEQLEIKEEDKKGSAKRQSDRINKKKSKKKRKDAVDAEGDDGGGK